MERKEHETHTLCEAHFPSEPSKGILLKSNIPAGQMTAEVFVLFGIIMASSCYKAFAVNLFLR